MSAKSKQAAKVGSREMDKAARFLVDRLAVHVANCPCDDEWPGVRLAPETRREYAQAFALLQNAERLLAGCVAR